MKDPTESVRAPGTLMFVCIVLLIIGVCAPAAFAKPPRIIMRDSLGVAGVKQTCNLVGCHVIKGLSDPDNQLYVVQFKNNIDVTTAIQLLLAQPGVMDAELDQMVKTQEAQASAVPSYLTDETPVFYYGATVWRGYVTQPGNALVGTSRTQWRFRTTGAGVTVAVIDTGVDPTHPVLKSVLVNGYDFTRNAKGGSEKLDVNANPDNNGAEPGTVNQRTVAVLDQRTVAVLDGNPQYAAFGHGTMTAGVVHLVAPQAKIMPLKAFSADGTGYSSDVMHAIYYAVKNGATVLSMSFDFSSYSPELAKAIQHANKNGVISVASAGNDGERTLVYPAALPGVIDVASTSNSDVQSSFTNYGAPPVWLAAPGEGVMTTYPWGTYAAAWGTSFSTPFVAGTAALMLGGNRPCSSASVPAALSRAHFIANPDMGFGRLDAYQAVFACRILR